jgi:hypothetical protein
MNINMQGTHPDRKIDCDSVKELGEIIAPSTESYFRGTLSLTDCYHD